MIILFTKVRQKYIFWKKYIFWRIPVFLSACDMDKNSKKPALFKHNYYTNFVESLKCVLSKTHNLESLNKVCETSRILCSKNVLVSCYFCPYRKQIEKMGCVKKYASSKTDIFVSLCWVRHTILRDSTKFVKLVEYYVQKTCWFLVIFVHIASR